MITNNKTSNEYNVLFFVCFTKNNHGCSKKKRRLYRVDKDIVFRAYITNLGRYNEGYLVGEWVDFPIKYENMDVKEAINEILCRIGVDGVCYEEYFITDFESDMDGLVDCFGEYENLLLLHFLACKIQEMDYGIEQFESMIAYGEMIGSVEELINLTDNAECFYFMPDVENDYDLGYEWVENSGIFTQELKSLGRLADYIDYESYGRDIRFDEGGIHTKNGYIALIDSMSISFDWSKDEIPKKYLQ